MKPTSKIKGIKPTSEVKATKLSYENIWIYNEIGMAYNETGMTYNGIYSYDALTPKSTIKSITPSTTI